ncbi:unnamed protein product [Diabrotica balteata]|uniref:Gamma-interferon-inducible lysosomal thiol reductase n=1 Tax=Diabrotica balteata TaxID=107213 RepID=A0A9N9SS47_DIABA|nr:unnamed protein product [Diabrotica balteata]
MKGKAINFLVLFSCLWLSEQAQVKVSVYYEVLCPDSIDFISNQFHPTYKDLKDYIDVEFIPYGHASETNITGQWAFTCQHGPAECFGNAFHSCVLALNSDKIKTENFVYCSMSSSDPASLQIIEQCLDKADLVWKTIKNCYFSNEYVKYLIQNGEKTRAAENTSFIPTIVLNDKFSQENQDDALSDFRKLICKTLNYEPKECKEEGIKLILA